jgi:hypothetical protein
MKYIVDQEYRTLPEGNLSDDASTPRWTDYGNVAGMSSKHWLVVLAGGCARIGFRQDDRRLAGEQPSCLPSLPVSGML